MKITVFLARINTSTKMKSVGLNWYSIHQYLIPHIIYIYDDDNEDYRISSLQPENGGLVAVRASAPCAGHLRQELNL